MDERIRFFATFGLRASAVFYAAQGNEKAAQTLTLLANSYQAGVDVDNHMREVAGLVERGETDWDDLHARIHAEGDELQSKATQPG